MPHARLAAIMLATAAVATAGCGGSKAASTTSSNGAALKVNSAQRSTNPESTPTPVQSHAHGKPLGRTAFTARADAICKHLNKKTATIVTTSLHTVGSTAGSLASYYREALVELAKLTPPASIAQDWDAVVADIRQIPPRLLTMGRLALDNDMKSTVSAELKVQKIQEHRLAIARRNGFTDCAEV